MGITEYIQQIGAYAGFAAVIGLAVLAALYFSTSRDLKRLRDEGVREGGPGMPPPPGQAAQRLQTQRPVPTQAAQPTVAGQPTIVQPPTAPGARTPAPAPATPGGAAAPPPARGTTPSRVPPRQPVGAPQRARQQAPPKQSWYSNIEPRFLVLIVAGVLVVGGGIIALLSIGGGEPEGEPFAIVSEGQTTGGGGTAPVDEPGEESVDPSQVTVAVLNGTAVPGLAASIGDTVEAAGFKRGNIDNAPTQAANESAVLYAPGNEAAAQQVAKELDISQVGEIDAETQSQAGNAQVVVVVGPDQAP